MNLRSVDLNLLTIFDAIYTEQNLSRAADRIGMSQPAMSAALGRLRLEFKDELFVRTGRGVRSTPRAVELQRPVRDILDRVTAVLSQTQQFDPQISERVFNIASTDYGGLLVIPQLLRHLQRLDASVKVNVWPQYASDLQDQMHFGSVDFAIDNLPITESDFRNVVLRKEAGWCLVRKRHPDIRQGLSVEQFLNAEHVVVFPQGDRVSHLESYLIEHGMGRKQVVRVPSFFNMPYIVQSTDYLCSLPEKMATHFATLHNLRALPLPFEDWVTTYYLMWHSSQESNPAHRWLRDIIVAISRDPDARVVSGSTESKSNG